MAHEDAISVYDFGSLLRAKLKSVSNVEVRGIISETYTSSRGHTYITVKDADGTACLECVAYNKSFEAGLHQEVVVRVGRADFYAPRGRLQAVIHSVECVGGGVSAREVVLAHLLSENIRQQAAPPPFPLRHVCIVTSINSAAYHDMKQSINERWNGLRVTVVNSSVQGEAAPEELETALRCADEIGCDVIVIGRGGGGKNDLAAFDTERVARAVASCKTPVVSAVGHESDWSVCDSIAGFRAKTPTAAIELILPRRLHDIEAQLEEKRSALVKALGAVLEKFKSNHETQTRLVQFAKERHTTPSRCNAMRAKLDSSMSSRLAHMHHKVKDMRAILCTSKEKFLSRRSISYSHSNSKLLSTMSACLIRHAHQLDSARRALDSSSRFAPLPQGLALVQKRGIVVSAEDLVEQDQIKVRWRDGWVTATVNKCQKVR